ncbi:MAG: hypothetical protein HY327_14365 [Chloroflexi bacterium]|nr:hypothetical protein [Chloroflexota bacterium]
MPRRAKPKSKRTDWRHYASLGLNGLVALSMVLGTVFLFTGAPTPQPVVSQTIEIPTLAPTVPATPAIIPTATSTPVASTPTPAK